MSANRQVHIMFYVIDDIGVKGLGTPKFTNVMI